MASSEAQQTLWQVYMVKASDDRLYTGISTDPERRLSEHQFSNKGAKFFRGRKAEAIVYLETVADRSSANKREAAIKKLPRSSKDQLILVYQKGLK